MMIVVLEQYTTSDTTWRSSSQQSPDHINCYSDHGIPYQQAELLYTQCYQIKLLNQANKSKLLEWFCHLSNSQLYTQLTGPGKTGHIYTRIEFHFIDGYYSYYTYLQLCPFYSHRHHHKQLLMARYAFSNNQFLHMLYYNFPDST